jgi:hypothetical protein
MQGKISHPQNFFEKMPGNHDDARAGAMPVHREHGALAAGSEKLPRI